MKRLTSAKWLLSLYSEKKGFIPGIMHTFISVVGLYSVQPESEGRVPVSARETGAGCVQQAHAFKLLIAKPCAAANIWSYIPAQLCSAHGHTRDILKNINRGK